MYHLVGGHSPVCGEEDLRVSDEELLFWELGHLSGDKLLGLPPEGLTGRARAKASKASKTSKAFKAAESSAGAAKSACGTAAKATKWSASDTDNVPEYRKAVISYHLKPCPRQEPRMAERTTRREKLRRVITMLLQSKRRN